MLLVDLLSRDSNSRQQKYILEESILQFRSRGFATK